MFVRDIVNGGYKKMVDLTPKLPWAFLAKFCDFGI
jgi:hypothetical protein